MIVGLGDTGLSAVRFLVRRGEAVSAVDSRPAPPGLDALRREFPEAPSETAKRHIKVSPFPDEPVGWIIDNVGPDMLCFASDYPHPEGTRAPIGKFEKNMPNCDQETMDKFYHGNMLDLMSVS